MHACTHLHVLLRRIVNVVAWKKHKYSIDIAYIYICIIHSYTLHTITYTANSKKVVLWKP